MATRKSIKEKAPSPKRESPVQLRLPTEVIQKLDELASQNNISRAALVAIACSRILKSGL